MGWQPKVSHRVRWLCPPSGVKLNLDGSYLQSIKKGGFGDVLRDSDDSVILSWFGSVESLNANEADVFAQLLSCLGVMDC